MSNTECRISKRLERRNKAAEGRASARPTSTSIGCAALGLNSMQQQDVQKRVPPCYLRSRGCRGRRDEALGHVAGTARRDHVECSRHAIHSDHSAINANVHFVAHKLIRCVLGKFAPMRTGEKRRRHHERSEHAATNGFHTQ